MEPNIPPPQSARSPGKTPDTKNDKTINDCHSYPRPQLRRAPWFPLNGPWDFAIDSPGAFHLPSEVPFDLTIQVPFSPETQASGIANTGFYNAVWYRRNFTPPPISPGERVHLHFGAVDYIATVWVNGTQVCTHQGGYTPFCADITHALIPNSPTQEIVLRAEDDPSDLAKPRGKQDWQLEPHSIWYPRTTGIWQTVWFEIVPATSVETLKWTSNLERWEIGLECRIQCASPQPLFLRVRLTHDSELLADDIYSVTSSEVHRRIALSDPGIDDYRNTLLWSPSSPTIIDAEVELRTADGLVLDRVLSYTALRAIAIQGDRFILNGRPLQLRMVLDQGYWPSSGLTAPNEDAFTQDILLVKNMGFNGVRKHQKIEDPRFLFWADHLGLLVWEEMPSAYRYTRRSIERLTREWTEVLERDVSHPCIVTWVPFNESWGVPDLPDSPAQRNYVQGLYHLTKALDPTRPVIGNDGWESIATDIIDIHDYDANPDHIHHRYAAHTIENKRLQRERPGGRMLSLDGRIIDGQPIMITEFGGIALTAKSDDAKTWGYSRSENPTIFLDRYSALLQAVRSLPSVAGFCYTQLTDTYQEANGLLFADRTPKAPLSDLYHATTGSRPDYDIQMEQAWRDRIMERQGYLPLRGNKDEANLVE